MVRNDTEADIKLSKNMKLGHVLEYEAAGCFKVKACHSDLAARAPKRSTNWVTTAVRRLVAGTAAMAAAFPATTASPLETVHATGVTIHGTPESTPSIAAVINRYPSLWQDTGNVTNVPESQWMDIPLVDNWTEIYKPGQVRVYPLGKADREVINNSFDKLHEQGRME